jgi:hypothetical protein
MAAVPVMPGAPAGGSNVVRIEGLTAFRAALARAAGSYPKELTSALSAAGAPIVSAASAKAPHVTGTLAASYATSVRGLRGRIISRAPYGAGAEWGLRGKWAGFQKYGPTPRFAGAAIDEKADEVAELIYEKLFDIVSAYGWFHA